MKAIFIPDYTDGNPYQRLLAQALEKQGVTVTYANPTGIFCLFKMLRQACQAEETVVHLHWIDALLPVGRNGPRTAARILCFHLGIWLLRLFRINMVWTVHNAFCHDGQHRQLEHRARRALAKAARTLFVHSPSVIAQLSALYAVSPTKFQVIDHGHYIDCCPNHISPQAARAQNDIPPDHLVYLCIGSIKPYKGVPDVIAAFQKIKIPDSTLMIVGQASDPALAAALEQQCRGNPRIKLLFKFVNDEEMQLYLNCADVVVYAFKDILTSGSLIMALSFKKAVIAPALGCIPDIVDSAGAFLYDPQDPQGLAQAMSSASGADLNKMGVHNFKIAHSFDWDRIARMTNDAYVKR